MRIYSARNKGFINTNYGKLGRIYLKNYCNRQTTNFHNIITGKNLNSGILRIKSPDGDQKKVFPKQNKNNLSLRGYGVYFNRLRTQTPDCKNCVQRIFQY